MPLRNSARGSLEGSIEFVFQILARRQGVQQRAATFHTALALWTLHIFFTVSGEVVTIAVRVTKEVAAAVVLRAIAAGRRITAASESFQVFVSFSIGDLAVEARNTDPEGLQWRERIAEIERELVLTNATELQDNFLRVLGDMRMVQIRAAELEVLDGRLGDATLEVQDMSAMRFVPLGHLILQVDHLVRERKDVIVITVIIIRVVVVVIATAWPSQTVAIIVDRRSVITVHVIGQSELIVARE